MIVFQSSPIPKDGRYKDIHVKLSVLLQFQSSPIPKDGRYQKLRNEHQHDRVSILAHPEGWALHDKFSH